MLHRQTHIDQANNQADKTHCTAQEILKDLCDAALGVKSTLPVAPHEAAALLDSLVGKEVLKERIKKIGIERKPYIVEFTARFNKYFETMGHNGIIERICFDRGCKYAFTGGADGVIKCWSIPDGMLVRSLYGHGNLISDLCINREGKLMVSVDYLGILNIWSLEKFELLNTVNLGSEAIFCEFLEREEAVGSAGRIFVVLADGTVNCIKFMQSEILEHKKNNFMEGECIKSICITDGGRMVICGGWWPFILVYDTEDLDRVIVLEDFEIQTLCAAKNSLKFAACNLNQIFSYTFYCEGEASAGNYLKKRGGDNSMGYWKRHVNEIPADEWVDGLSFLPSFLLVAACSDDIIRVYDDDQLVLSFPGEGGTIYAHPTQNILAVVGTRLTIYQIPGEGTCYQPYNDDTPKCRVRRRPGNGTKPTINVIYTEGIFISLNDCQFSDDGRFFITCDDQGVIRAYSVYDPIVVPEQQFFLSDLIPTASEFTETVNFYRQKNAEWYAVPYSMTEGSTKNRCYLIEKQAISTLERLKIDQEKFRARYRSSLYADEDSESEEESQSDDETYVMSEGESIESDTAEESAVSAEEPVGRLRGFRRRLVDTDSSGRRRRRFIVEESSDETVVQTRRLRSTSPTVEPRPRRLRRSLSPVAVDSHGPDPAPPRRLRRNRIVEENSSRNSSSDLNESGINTEFESVLTAFASNWLAVCSLYLDSQVFFNLPAYLEFMQLEPRLAYPKSYPKQSGIFSVTYKQLKFIGRIPYLIIVLDSRHTIKVYEHPRSGGVLCTADQYSIATGETILYFDGELHSGEVCSAQGMRITVGRTEMLRSLAAVQYAPLGISPIEYSPSLKVLFGRSRGHKAAQKPILNYSFINLKLERNLYRSAEEVVEDLKYLAEFASGAGDPVKSRAKEIYRQYKEELAN